MALILYQPPILPVALLSERGRTQSGGCKWRSEGMERGGREEADQSEVRSFRQKSLHWPEDLRPDFWMLQMASVSHMFIPADAAPSAVAGSTDYPAWL